jgi:repressor LexA
VFEVKGEHVFDSNARSCYGRRAGSAPAKGGEMEPITDRQRKILDFIQTTVKQRGYPPSVREIGEAVGLHSPSSVHAQLAGLAEKGLLAKDPSRPRAIRVNAPDDGSAVEVAGTRRVPVLGQIAAGAPLLAEQHVEDTLVVPEELTGKGTLFALRVRGDSMINAGIFDGDTVVVREQATAEDGDIVAALIDEEEATVKRLSRKGGTLRLLAENDAYAPIEAQNVRVLGKVVSVLRRL